MALTIVFGVTVVVLGLAGLLRGVRRGVVALAGTLLGAVLVDLWSERLSTWLRETIAPERPALPTFALVATLFLLTSLIVGYGGSALLPRLDPKAKQPAAIVNGLLGALLGALNGALIMSYLLRYAEEIWRDDTVSRLVESSLVGPVLEQWLPWFVMAMVAATTLFVLLRLGTAMVRGRAVPPQPAPAAPPAVKPAGTAPAAPPSQAAPKSVPEQDKRVLDQIKQTTSEKK